VADAVTLTVRDLVAGASRQITRLKRVDRAATVLITIGGLLVVVSVLGILVFIAAEAAPLFSGATGRLVSATVLDTATSGKGALKAIGSDEYQRYTYFVEPDAKLRLFDSRSGKVAREFPLTPVAGATIVSSSRSPSDDFVAAGTSDGRAALFRVRFATRYEGQKLVDLDITVNDRGLVALDPGGRPIREISYREIDGRKVVAGLLADQELVLWQTNDEGQERKALLQPSSADKFTEVRVGRGRLIAGTNTGRVYDWDVSGEAPVLTNISGAAKSPITALEWLNGDVTFVAGSQAGDVSAWFPVRLREEDTVHANVGVHAFESQGAPVTDVSASLRDKSFITLGHDGSAVLRHLTTGRTLLRLPAAGGPVTTSIIAPRGNALLAMLGDGRLFRYEVSSPHPEASLGSLFGKVWYEGYTEPAYVWQSTGSTDESEPKLSLIPLVFGTIKGTLYAVLFAIPLAVLGALYTSQFAHPSIRNRIKPTVEIMAALPSVVIGFIAGLWMAPLVERNLVTVFLAPPLMMLFGSMGVLIWNRIPKRLVGGLRAGSELLLIVPLILLAIWVASVVAPAVERTVFAGDMRLWLNSVGLTYDQRNSLVVGIAMGFAVIPIIFTISDDAFMAVPSSLTAASLAMGASRWQTAVRVVLPTASPGIFSAIMVGFGRAVGETMIVLMATGNTPVLDWSIFNGMRTLSANIAVEVPEAPYGGTLYRVLFLTAALLFLMTFVLNTVAEIIRQRLRERYKVL
jgi:phosphate transport system permease protein